MPIIKLNRRSKVITNFTAIAMFNHHRILIQIVKSFLSSYKLIDFLKFIKLLLKPVKFALLNASETIVQKNCKLIASILFYIVRMVNDMSDTIMVTFNRPIHQGHIILFQVLFFLNYKGFCMGTKTISLLGCRNGGNL